MTQETALAGCIGAVLAAMTGLAAWSMAQRRAAARLQQIPVRVGRRQVTTLRTDVPRERPERP